MKHNTVSIQLNREQGDKVEETLSKVGWSLFPSKNEYIVLFMKNDSGSVCSLYSSGKIVFQGVEDFSEIVKMIRGDIDEEITPHIGVDEVGKGDYFGPLVVTACFVNEEFIQKIDSLGIRDSKKLSDGKILDIYSKLKDYPYYYTSIVYPEEYNKLVVETKNVAVLLARQHSKVIENALEDLKSKNIECDYVVIDQFSNREDRVLNELGELGKTTKFYQFHKGELDIAVACASVFARGIFLNEMQKMEDEYYFKFPKGASNVISVAKDFLNKHGEEELGKVAKVTFKTTRAVLSTS